MPSRIELAEAQNLERARDADKAMVAYVCVKECRKIESLADARSGLDLQEWLTDLLSDFRHWARVNDVDFEKSVEDTDSLGYNIGITSRLPGRVMLTYDATYLDDIGGTLAREDWRHALRLEWGYRQVRFSLRAEQADVLQGDSQRENYRIFAELRRRF